MQFSVPGLCYDALFVLLLLLVACSGMRRGFLSSLVGLAGAIAGIVLGVWATRYWAPTLYTDHIGLAIGEQITETVSAYSGDLSAALETLSFLPQNVRDNLNVILQGTAEGVVPRLVTALEPVILPLLQALLFLLVCCAVRLAVRFLGWLMRGVNALPLLGDFNKILGFAFGFVTGVLNCWLLALALWLLAGLLGARYPLLSTATLEQSFVYRLMQNVNPFTGIY